MPNIRYICVSDLHLGAANSVLTNLDHDGNHIDGPAPMLTAVIDGLRQLIRASGTTTPPTLVVHGDLFELALTTMEVAADTFGELVNAAWGDATDPLFADEVLFVPGNHDHHMWELVREHEYEDELHGTFQRIPSMRHVTPMMREKLPADDYEPLVAVLARRALERVNSATKLRFHVHYPNLGLTNDRADRAVVITHGHYLEPMYRAMSFLHNVVTPERPPRLSVAELEADNWAWIDFFWSTMGRSGEGDDAAIPVLYELMQHEDSMDAVVDRVLDDALPRTRSPIRRAERWMLRRAGRRVATMIASRERHHAAVLSASATRGLSNYLAGPVRGQLEQELTGMPSRVDLVFGHTHKPFAAAHAIADYEAPVIAHNSGGWVVDAVQAEPLKGGSIVLVSDDLEVADLCIYRQEPDPSHYRVSVIPVTDPPDEPTPFRAWLTEVGVRPDEEPWAGIAELAAQTVRQRQYQLEQRIERGTFAVRTEPPVGPRGW